VKGVIKDLSSGLQSVVVMLVLSCTYLLSDGAEQSLDEFQGENIL
jgi:hypothetical protein